MAVTHYTLTAKFTDLLGSAYDAQRSKVAVFIETNVRDTEGVTDSVSDQIALGPKRAIADSTGTVTFANLIGSDSDPADINITAGTLQYRVTAEYINAVTNKRGQKWSSGWFSLTANTNLADVVAEQYVPASWITQATEELQAALDAAVTDAAGEAIAATAASATAADASADAAAASATAAGTAKTGAEAARDLAQQYRDEAHDISGISTSDGVVAALVPTTSGSATSTALAASFARKWKATTAYSVGDVVVAPDGSIVERTVAGTSGSTYSATNWKAATGFTNAVKAQTQVRLQASGAANPPGVVHLVGDTAYVDSTAGTAGVFGGGHTTYENVIGGNTATVNTTTSNVPVTPPTFTTAPSWSFIWGGYDNVVNGWACQVQGYHCKIEVGANHCTIGGGSVHSIPADTAYGTIGGGTGNDIAGSGATVSGGSTNHATGTQSSIGGGLTNTASGAQATIGGGSTNTSTASGSTVSGGRTNDATANDAAIGGGVGNDATGIASTVAGGSTNAAGNQYASVGGGLSNAASGIGATIPGGRGNTASGDYSQASGREALANVTGMRAFASGQFAAQGDAQAVEFVLRNTTTDATAKELFTQGTGTRISVPADSTLFFEVMVVARRTDADGESASYKYTGCIDRGATAATTAFVGTVTETVVAEDNAAWGVAITAGTSDGTLRIAATGEAAKNVRWVAYVRAVSVSG